MVSVRGAVNQRGKLRLGVPGKSSVGELNRLKVNLDRNDRLHSA
jgi:hypothetical protein